MKKTTTRSDGIGHIKLRQKLVRFAAYGVCISFALLPFHALLDSKATEEFLFWAALAALFLVVAAAAFLASVKCPQCGETFIGNTVPESGGPEPSAFAKTCRYCGHAG